MSFMISKINSEDALEEFLLSNVIKEVEKNNKLYLK